MKTLRLETLGLALWEVLAEGMVLEAKIVNAGLANLQETFLLPLGTAKQFFAVTRTYMKNKISFISKLAKGHDAVMIQEAHGTTGMYEAWAGLRGYTAFFPAGVNTGCVGVGILLSGIC